MGWGEGGWGGRAVWNSKGKGGGLSISEFPIANGVGGGTI